MPLTFYFTEHSKYSTHGDKWCLLLNQFIHSMPIYKRTINLSTLFKSSHRDPKIRLAFQTIASVLRSTQLKC